MLRLFTCMTEQNVLKDISNRNEFQRLIAHEDVEIEDNVEITFNNIYDKRFANLTKMKGEVTHFDKSKNVESGSVVLAVENDNRKIAVTNAHGVYIYNNGEVEGKLVGTVVFSSD